MSPTPGRPYPGTDITILITRVNSNPLCVLVELWGNFSMERKADYDNLAKDIQSPRNTFQEFEGNSGDQCLVQVNDTWYRSRIVSRNGSKYSVFLFDKGRAFSATTSMLAWGKKEHFHLPPEVEFCLMTNVVPVSSENRWSPMAVEFLKSLCGKTVKAYVQDVLEAQKTFLLHIPSISNQMYEMGFAKKVSAEWFKDFVLKSLQSDSGTAVTTGPQLSSMTNKALETKQKEKQQSFMYPELLAGTVETVVITEVTNPLRIFCQLKVFSQELKKLTDQITQHYDGRMTSFFEIPELLGSPCAARGGDCRWYRSVLQQVLPAKNIVEVLNVDYGSKQFVHMKNVKQLAEEFFRMPVVTYVCSLHGIIDKGMGWTAAQIDYLRSLLLLKTVIAKFEYHSLSEGVHYVTLYGEENTNINNLFGSKERCLLDCDGAPGMYAINVQSEAHAVNRGKIMTDMFPVEDLPLNSSHLSVVQYASNPSEFWIQTQKYALQYDELMDSISHLYHHFVNEDAVRNPPVGLYCVAKAQDDAIYRATVLEVGEFNIKVFFVDSGKTEVIKQNSIRALPDDFKALPKLAIKCRLAGVKPKDKTWSLSATDFFRQSVTNKVLNIKVAAKFDGGYVVWVMDSTGNGEKDVSMQMCSSGFAVMDEAQKKTHVQMTCPRSSAVLNSGASLLQSHKNSYTSFQPANALDPISHESSTAGFKEQMFPIGSSLEVSVCYMESPNDFWCQLVQNGGQLKLLMQDIQTYYEGSHFRPFTDTACVARHPNNGLWYRALIIKKHTNLQIDVLFVDYGQINTVTLHDLRSIWPAFLNLKGQAFRCSLYNPLDPTSGINNWNEEADAQFQEFVDTAASSHVILKCTIYAVMCNEQKVVFNVVDLETPFESVCSRLVHFSKKETTTKTLGSSFHTYYYSTHNIKTGTEEMVTVTSANDVNHFYCHLDRNASVMEELTAKLGYLCNLLKNAKLPTTFGTVCFAKYTDGNWYRALIKAIQPSIRVHFVDYGDTLDVDRSDLLPVPREASDIMSVPVQAVECGLSDIPANVSSEMNSWFKMNATHHSFKALVVAKEPDGKLLVELYYGKTQLNSKIKKIFPTDIDRGRHDGTQVGAPPGISANNAKLAPKIMQNQVEMEDSLKAPKENVSARGHIGKNAQKTKVPTLELYRPPHQRQLYGGAKSTVINSSKQVETHTIRPLNAHIVTKQTVSFKSSDTDYSKEYDTASKPNEAFIEALAKLKDLPIKSIKPDMEVNVSVSHCNSLLSFYVQFVSEEDEIFSVVEKLNSGQSAIETIDIKDLHSGDLIQAEFPDDSSWYRAVVREIHADGIVMVEFIDFGNVAQISISKICRLPKEFLDLPTYSTHCLLSEASTLEREVALGPEVVSAFKKDIASDGDKELKCRFIRQLGSAWEVSLEDSGKIITYKTPNRDLNAASEMTLEKSEQMSFASGSPSETQSGSKPLQYIKGNFTEGQIIEAYVAVVASPHEFWCQSADSEELDKITVSVSEESNVVQSTPIDTNQLSCGSPCIALFADDEQWYRAKVVSKDGDMLSIFFVDYGNETKVNIKDVRELPLKLAEIPVQAFLCELEGFDGSYGSWDDSSVGKLSELVMDKLIKLTVLKLRKDYNNACSVRIECGGQVINEMMEVHWQTSQNVHKADACGPSTSPDTLTVLCNSARKDVALSETCTPKDHNNHRTQESDDSISFVESQSDYTDQESANVPSEIHRVLCNSPPAGEDSKLTTNSVTGDNSNSSIQSHAISDNTQGEMDHIASKCYSTETVQEMRLLDGNDITGQQVFKTVLISVLPEADQEDVGLIHPLSDTSKDHRESPLPEDCKVDLTSIFDKYVDETEKDTEQGESTITPDGSVNVACKINSRDPNDLSEMTGTPEDNYELYGLQSSSTERPLETQSLNPVPLHYIKHKFTEGQNLEAYVTIMTDTGSFWCQLADTGELDKITLIISEVGNAIPPRPANASLLICGSPCIALFADDEQWYRAEVISKDGDMLSIFFVDYGNETKVNIKDVRELPLKLSEIPSQAFLCELEGFDGSYGSWDDGSVGKLSELITDKLLKITIVQVKRTSEENIMSTCFVKVECDGRVMNDIMKDHWQTSKNLNKADASGRYQLCKGTAVSESPPEDDDSPLIQISDESVYILECAGDLSEVCQEPSYSPPEVEKLTTYSNTVDSSSSVQSQALSDNHEETDNLLSECNLTEDRHLTKLLDVKDMTEQQLLEMVPPCVSSDAKHNDGVTQPQIDDISICQPESFCPAQDCKQDYLDLNSNGNEETDKVGEVQKQENQKWIEQDNALISLNAVADLVQGTDKATVQSASQHLPDITESSPVSADIGLDGSYIWQVTVEEETETAASKETVAKSLDAPKDNDSHLVTDSELSQRRPAKGLSVGSACVVWSPAVKSWCKARVLKNFTDYSIVLIADHNTDMLVDHESIFEKEIPESEQFSNDNGTNYDCSSSQSGTVKQSDDSDDTIAEDVDPVTTEEMPSVEDAVKTVELGKTCVIPSERSQVDNSSSSLLQQPFDTATEQGVETADVVLQETPVPPTQNQSDLRSEVSPHHDYEHALLIDTESEHCDHPAASVPPCDMFTVEDVAGAAVDPCSRDVCSDELHQMMAADQPTSIYTDPSEKTDDVFEELPQTSGDCLDTQLAMLVQSLVIDDGGADDDSDSVIFVKEIQPPQLQQQK